MTSHKLSFALGTASASGLLSLALLACSSSPEIPTYNFPIPTAAVMDASAACLPSGAGSTSVGDSAGSTDAGGASSSTVSASVEAVLPSPGCGKALPQDNLGNELSLGAYAPFTTRVTGRTLDPQFSVCAHDRGYYVWLPKDYDATKPYRVTFLFMGCGDRNAASTATYKLMAPSGDKESIYVAMNMPPPGLPPEGKDCYDNTIGKQSVEWEFMGLTATTVQNDFCIDENRLFVSGYSSGAWVSNMFGCYFAGKDPTREFGPDISVRGQATVTGGPVFPDVPCGNTSPGNLDQGKVAAMWIHDSDDTENIIGGNSMTSLPRVLAANGCTDGVNGVQVPWGSTPDLSGFCKQYTACPADYPVIFCTTSGKGHSSQDALAIPGFIEFESLMDPK